MEKARALSASLAGVNAKSRGDVDGATERTNAYLGGVAAALSAPVLTSYGQAVLGNWEAGAGRLLDAIASEGSGAAWSVRCDRRLNPAAAPRQRRRAQHRGREA